MKRKINNVYTQTNKYTHTNREKISIKKEIKKQKRGSWLYVYEEEKENAMCDMMI